MLYDEERCCYNSIIVIWEGSRLRPEYNCVGAYMNIYVINNYLDSEMCQLFQCGIKFS